MVTSLSLDKISAVGKLPNCLQISQLSVGRTQKIDNKVGEDGSIDSHLNKTMRSDVYLDSTCYKADNKHLVGVIGAQDESSLFSSSLSDLVHNKLRLSNKILSRQSSSAVPHDDVGTFKSPKESDGQSINNILPDEEELFSGIADDMGPMGHANGGNDLDDFDLFFGSGDIDLGDDGLQSGQRNERYPLSAHHAFRGNAIQRLPNGSMVGDSSPHESSRLFKDYPLYARMSSIGSEFCRLEATQGLHKMQLDNRGIPNLHPHAQLQNLVNGTPQFSMNVDGMSALADGFDDIRRKVPETLNMDIRHMGLNGHVLEVNEGGFRYSPNEIRIAQFMASKSNSYQNQHLRSVLTPNSPSFLSNNHSRHIGRFYGSLRAPHHMMNMASPMHQLQAGSAPVIKASLWDRQQMYMGESRETSDYQMGSIRSMGIPGFSPSHPREISSRDSFEVSKNGGLHSPQQMSHVFHERSSMNSLPKSFGSPSERIINRRNDTNLSHADKKHYELNIDRIMRGDDCRTTLMIKNIPNKYTSKMLLATIDEFHRGKYDFIYLPIDFKNKCNMGYAFINIIDPIQIISFHQTFEGRKWEKFNSEKVASLAYARIQGKAALIAHFQNSSLMNEDKRCRPILFHTNGPNAGDQEPFPTSSSFRSKAGRQQQVTGMEENQ